MIDARLAPFALTLLLVSISAHPASDYLHAPIVLAQSTAADVSGSRKPELSPSASKEFEIEMTELKLQHLKGELTDAEYERRQKEIVEKFEKAAPEEKAFELRMTDLKLQHLKGEISDAEYMRLQRELVNENNNLIRKELGMKPAGVPEARGTAPARYRVAVFPMGEIVPESPSGTEALLYRHAHQYINTHEDMELVFSEYGSAFKRGGVGTQREIWTGGFTNKTPNTDRISYRARQVNANVALLISHKKRTAGWYGNDFEVDVYVLELDTNESYHRKGDEGDFENTIESAFRGMLTN